MLNLSQITESGIQLRYFLQGSGNITSQLLPLLGKTHDFESIGAATSLTHKSVITNRVGAVVETETGEIFENPNGGKIYLSDDGRTVIMVGDSYFAMFTAAGFACCFVPQGTLINFDLEESSFYLEFTQGVSLDPMLPTHEPNRELRW